MAGHKRDDPSAMVARRWTLRDDHPAVRREREGSDGALDLVVVAHIIWAQFHPERRRHCLDGRQLTDPSGESWITKHRHARHVRCKLLEQRKPFPAGAIFEQ